MKPLLKKTGIMVCLASISIFLNAQMAVVDFMKVKAGQESRYVDIEHAWKKIHEVRQKDGTILSWNLYAVEFAGQDDPYQYVTVTTYARPAKYSPISWNDFTKAMSNFGEKDLNDFFENTNNARVLVKTSVYGGEVFSRTITKDTPSIFVINFMHVNAGQENAYVNAETGVFLPMHEEAIKTKKRVSWGLWALQTGDLQHHQYVTVDAYTSFAQMDSDQDGAAMFKKVHPGKNMAEVLNKAIKTRELNQRQIWRWIDGIN